jgi:hypothetical protein
MNSVTLYEQPTRLGQIITLSNSSCYSTQSFLMLQCLIISHCYSAQSFSDATVLSHFALLQCSVVPHAKGAQSFIISTVLIDFPLQEGAQSFLVTTVLCYFPMLQYSAILYYYSTHPFLVQKELSH